MQRWKLIIEYNGAGYAGWQIQENMPSIQQSIEEAIYAFCQQEVKVQASGRTDAGVHARGQVAHFDLDYGSRPLDGYALAKAINAHLRPQAISVVNAQEAAQDFSARFDAINRYYVYRILNRPSFPAIENGLVWHVKRPLNVELMREGAKLFLGRHDFTTFRSVSCQAKSPEKTLDRFDIEEKEYDNCGGREIICHVESRSFLHHQVRNMVGTLALVGEGKWQPEDIQTAMDARDRKEGGPTAPAEGLYFMRVDY
jgi:tRNA pseudouridine38-40 synthase